MFTASDQSFIILQNTLLTGITNVSFNHSVNEEAVLLLAGRKINRKINKPTVTTCNITKRYGGLEFLKSLTGFVGLSGQFIYGTDVLDFNEAAISQYSLSMDTQGAPQIRVKLNIYGDLKPAAVNRKNNASVDESLINLNAESFVFNFMNKSSPITNFSFNADFDLKPTYEISSIKSSAVKILPPVKFSASADIEMTEQEYENITGISETEQFDRNVTIEFKNSNSGILNELSGKFYSLVPSGLETGLYPEAVATIKNTGVFQLDLYDLKNLSLSSQNISASTNETIKLKTRFGGYALSLPTGNPPSQPKLEASEIGGVVDDAITNFRTGFLDIPKFSGSWDDLGTGVGIEDFESFEEGPLELSRINLLFVEPPNYTTIIDFESESTGVTSKNLTLLGEFGLADVELTGDNYGFANHPTGATLRDLYARNGLSA